MSDGASVTAFGVVALLGLGVLMGVPASCMMQENREITERVKAACAGDLQGDAARTAACISALQQRARGN